MDAVRFGLIACSSIARRRFLPALKRVSSAQAVCIGSRNTETAAELAYEFSVARHGNYEDVLSNPHVDAVYLSTPATLRLEWVSKAAAAICDLSGVACWPNDELLLVFNSELTLNDEEN